MGCVLSGGLNEGWVITEMALVLGEGGRETGLNCQHFELNLSNVCG